MARTATGAVALQTERDCSRSKQETAERERTGSAVRSAQRMSARPAGPCREATMPARYTKDPGPRIPRFENRHPKTWRHLAPNFSFGRKQLHVEFCSIVAARTPAFALMVWNGTGIRFAPSGSSSPLPRMRNDWRPRTRNRSPSRRPRSACSLSSRTSIAHQRRISNIFFGINDRRDRPGGNTFRRDNIGNGTGRNRWKPWLLDTRCHNHRRKEQRAPEKIRCSRQVNRISCIDEPAKNPEEQPRSDNESD